jgi:hypothetical protein
MYSRDGTTALNLQGQFRVSRHFAEKKYTKLNFVFKFNHTSKLYYLYTGVCHNKGITQLVWRIRYRKPEETGFDSRRGQKNLLFSPVRIQVCNIPTRNWRLPRRQAGCRVKLPTIFHLMLSLKMPRTLLSPSRKFSWRARKEYYNFQFYRLL